MQVESIAECSREHSAVLSFCIKGLLVIIFWSSFELPLRTGFTIFAVILYCMLRIFSMLLFHFLSILVFISIFR